ncbi:MAG: precorrin-8X methylmutase [Chroococcus sp. CMT-3BRIN-NPC107]|jgi:precorrin-8X/cobalt-precorrin-8 methylmutase|nr:precorrin-8X methylmutase [Chroococcus sp. CMT-3BRIN-NPC107]
MEWQINDAQNLALIDREIGDYGFSPAQYEIVRRVIYATGDFEYKSLIRFSDRALPAGAAALAARSTIIVDLPMVQVGITSHIQKTFANPVYCSADAHSWSQKEQLSSNSWGIETLAKRYPEAIFVISQGKAALTALLELIESEEIRPALVVGTPAGFVDVDVAKQRLNDSNVPHIRIDGRKGSAVVATAIINALVELAWQAYGHDDEG